MKIYLYILVFSIISGCASDKYVIRQLAHLSPKMKGDSLFTELEKKSPEMIIAYYDGCVGCNEGYRKYYIYWFINNEGHLVKYDEYAEYECKGCGRINIDMVANLVDSLKKESLDTADFTLSHYPYDRLKISIKGKQISYEIASYEKSLNEMSYHVILIDKIKSYLYDKPPVFWEGKNFKEVKVKLNKEEL